MKRINTTTIYYNETFAHHYTPLEKDVKTLLNFQDAEMAELFGEDGDAESKEPRSARSAPSAKAPKSRATAPAAKTKAGWWALPDVPEEPVETPVEERPEGGKKS